MSSIPDSTAAQPAAWPALALSERRVLGVLVEKAKTTPDAYPLSLNSLVTGCNQKSNREPVLHLSDVDVEDAMTAVQKKGLATKITGSGRVERWRHNLYEAWRVEKVELAILGELLLRGPQTEGELRGRASRMEPIADLEALRGALKPLKERGLVVYLMPEDRRGTVLTHGFHPAEELDRLRARFQSEAARTVEEEPAPRPASMQAPIAAPTTALHGRVDSVESELAGLRQTIATLQDSFTAMAEQIRLIKEGLGLP